MDKHTNFTLNVFAQEDDKVGRYTGLTEEELHKYLDAEAKGRV